MPIMAYGLIYNMLLLAAGAGLLLLAMYGWALEPSVAPESDFEPDPPAGGSSLEVAARG
jgi:cytochrome c oxidase subunit 1